MGSSPCQHLNANGTDTSNMSKNTQIHVGTLVSKQPNANAVHAKYAERNSHEERKNAAWPCADGRRNP